MKKTKNLTTPQLFYPCKMRHFNNQFLSISKLIGLNNKAEKKSKGVPKLQKAKKYLVAIYLLWLDGAELD